MEGARLFLDNMYGWTERESRLNFQNSFCAKVRNSSWNIMKLEFLKFKRHLFAIIFVLDFHRVITVISRAVCHLFSSSPLGHTMSTKEIAFTYKASKQWLLYSTLKSFLGHKMLATKTTLNYSQAIQLVCL